MKPTQALLDEKISKEELFDAYGIAKSLIKNGGGLETLYQFGVICSRIGKITEANQNLKSYIARGGNNSFSFLNLGHTYKALRNFEMAESQYREFIAKNESDAGHGYWHLSDLKDIKFEEHEIAHMKNIARDESTSATNRMYLNFSLGNILERKGQFKESFGYLHTANNFHCKNKPFNRSAFKKLVNDLHKVIRVAEINPQDSHPRPIFVLGLPRSGSTLCEQILSSHSKILATDELPFINRIAVGLEHSGDYCDALAKLDKTEILNLRENYFQNTLHYRDNDTLMFIDKSPINFLHIGLIKALFPDAIIVNTFRNSLDNAISLYKRYFPSGHEYSYQFSDISIYIDGYLRLMRHWDNIFPGHIFHFRYETLVETKNELIEELLAFCNVELQDNCLRHHENSRAVNTPSADQVSKPIYSSAINSWKNFSTYIDLNSILTLSEINTRVVKSFVNSPQKANVSPWAAYWAAGEKSLFLSGNKGSALTTYWTNVAKHTHATSILDLCTGNGDVLQLFASELGALRDVKLRGVDFASTSAQYENYELIGDIDICSLPYNNEEFDLITSQFGIEYSNLDMSIAEAARVCKSGGKLILICHSSRSTIVKDNKIIHSCSEELITEVFPLFTGMIRGLDAATDGNPNGGIIAAKYREVYNTAISDIHSKYGDALFDTGFPAAVNSILEQKSTQNMCKLFDDFCIEFERAQLRLLQLFEAALDENRKTALIEKLKINGFKVRHEAELSEDNVGVLGYTIEATKTTAV